MRQLKPAGGIAAAVFAVALAGCGTAGGGGVSTTANRAPAPSPTTTAASAEPFGPACAKVPTDPANAGSFEAMAKVPVATAASGNPLLSTLVGAVGKAQLGDSLNSATNITVFAPTNDAFAEIPAADLDAVLANDTMLKSVLTYHVVGQRLAPDQLVGTHKTLQGGDLMVTGSGDTFTVNGTAAVICGNVQTQNATVYIIDGVLLPAS